MLRNKLYYRVKPFIPQGLRTTLRRRLASRLRDSVVNVWPIMPGSEQSPDGWPGWPGGKKFALVLTHDVESAAGLRRCRELMKLEMELGLRSSFNFIPEGGYKIPSELRDELVRNGFEVGVHDLRHDGRLFASRREFGRRAARINNCLHEWKAVGFRSAFMLHQLDWLHELNISYDASTFDTDPFEPQPEGRHTIFPFWVPRPLTNHESQSTNDASPNGYIELPYTLPQDSTLFVLLREKTPGIWLRKLDWIAEHGGMALVLTHPDYMSLDGLGQTSRQYPIAFYKQFLKYIQDKYSDAYWLALPREVAAYAKQAISRRVAPLNGVRPEQLLDSRENKDPDTAEQGYSIADKKWRLRGKRAAVLLFSYYPNDPRPRRAAEALAREGVTVELVCLQSSRDEPRREIINGVNVFRVAQKRYRGGKIKYARQYSAFILRSFAHLAFRSVTRKYDFVHVHNMPDVLVFSAWVPKLLGAKIILDLHDPMPELMRTIFQLSEQSFSVRLLKRLEKWSIGFADLVLTVNRACKTIYSSRSCPAEKIKVVINSPEDDIFRFQPANAQSSSGAERIEPFVILYHGSLVPRNGFDLAVEALETVQKSIPSVRLIVCGDRTSFFEEVMQSARERGLQESVEYLGAKNRTEIVEAINSCDLGIIPNHRNTFTEINTPTRIFEYLALGKPVIAPLTQGIRDYFDEGDLIFFQAGDANDLARKIEFAFSNPKGVEEIVKRGQQIYLSHTWSNEKSRLLNSIGKLV